VEANAREFFEMALATPSPSGYEGVLQRKIKEYIEPHADSVTLDVHGNLIAAKNADAPLRVMLAGHVDQIALVVHYIDDEGFLYVKPIGGWDPIMLVGQRAEIWTKLCEGDSETAPLLGVIGKKPIHLMTEEDRKRVPKIKDIWIDIGAKDKEQAQEMVRVGDPVTVRMETIAMPNERICAPGMDDKAGMWVVIEALRRVDASKLKVGVFAVSTVQEELGLRGARTSAFGIDPHVGIAVDVTFSSDCPTLDKKEEGEIKLGDGPVIYRGPNMNHVVVDRLIKAADAAEINYQLAADGRATGTDANAMQINRAGVAAGLVSVPNRYMHSPVELISLEDLDRAADLLARFVEEIEPGTTFIP